MKILVNVSVPAISESFDISLPDSMRIKNAVSLIATTVEEISNCMYVVSGEEQLCSVEKNILLKSNATLQRYGVENGDHLVMI